MQLDPTLKDALFIVGARERWFKGAPQLINNFIEEELIKLEKLKLVEIIEYLGEPNKHLMRIQLTKEGKELYLREKALEVLSDA